MPTRSKPYSDPSNVHSCFDSTFKSPFPFLFDVQYDEPMRPFFISLWESLQLGRKMGDPLLGRFSDVNELFIGYSNGSADGAISREIGTGVHQGDVHNHYLQLCGSKFWRIADRKIRYGDDRDTVFFSGHGMNREQNLLWREHPNVYAGVTGPGDM